MKYMALVRASPLLLLSRKPNYHLPPKSQYGIMWGSSWKPIDLEYIV